MRGIRQFFEEVEGIFDDIVFEEEEILEFGDEVLVISTGRFRGRTSGADVTARGAILWTVRDGKLVRFRFYQTKEDALEDLALDGELDSGTLTSTELVPAKIWTVQAAVIPTRRRRDSAGAARRR